MPPRSRTPIDQPPAPKTAAKVRKLRSGSAAGDNTRAATASQEQQQHNCSNGSSGPQGRRASTRRTRVDRKDAGPQLIESGTVGIDTIFLTRRLADEEGVRLRGQWRSDRRWTPGALGKTDWSFFDCSSRGWKLWWDEESRVLEVRLNVPVVMDPAAITNYPLREFSVRHLESISREIARAMGLSGSNPLRWHDFGVRGVSCTGDFSVADPQGTANVLHGIHHAGAWSGYRKGIGTTCQWKSGDRSVLIYCKGPELRSKLGRARHVELERRVGPVDNILRFEVSLQARSIKAAFGLADSDRLPKLEMVSCDFVRWVLYDEVYNRMKIRRLAQRKASKVDLAVALADDLVSEARGHKEQPNAALVCKLVGAYLLLSATTNSKSVCDRYGFARASVNALKRRLNARGFPVGIGIEGNRQRLLRSFVNAFRTILGDEAPRKPIIRATLVDAQTITATWLPEEDWTRAESVEGMCVDPDDDDPEYLEILSWVAAMNLAVA